ncbi:MAG: hypothetical protein A2W31_03120 [Planctomycetes bacterium RBG_16_64_10]|nr:MAG: hypothetical protein A2W31_03120 [Planctomycetes bacterium RBG_16_64_10]
MRVAIVNDAPIAIEALRRVVSSHPDHTVAWTAVDGTDAIEKCERDRPDVVLMDLIMPGMNGAEATRQIMRRCPCPILVVTATVAGNYALVCEALSHGAYDAVATPVLGGRRLEQAGAPLLAKLDRVAKIRARLMAPCERAAPEQSEPARPAAARQSPLPIVAIGASTGGPQAVQAVLSPWPREFPAAVIIAQHIGADFADPLAKWLAESCRLEVRTARDGDRPKAGTVLVAGTEDHLILQHDGKLAYTSQPVANPFRPSADVLFRSLAQYGGPQNVAVLLTGIGRDGAHGMLELRRAGWHTIAQDEPTSVVYGMPQAARELGAAAEILPVRAIADSIIRRIARPRSNT